MGVEAGPQEEKANCISPEIPGPEADHPWNVAAAAVER
jgi:hypothetical protein